MHTIATLEATARRSEAGMHAAEARAERAVRESTDRSETSSELRRSLLMLEEKVSLKSYNVPNTSRLHHCTD